MSEFEKRGRKRMALKEQITQITMERDVLYQQWESLKMEIKMDSDCGEINSQYYYDKMLELEAENDQVL